MQRSHLPVRPLTLQFGFRAKRWLGVGLLLVLTSFVVGAMVVALLEIPEIQREARIWEHGVAAPGASVSGSERSKFIFNSYDLEVSYTTPAGEERHKLSLSLIFGSVDQGQPAVVHYDREHPDQFAVSWAAAASGARWAYVGVMSAVMLGFALVMLFGVRQVLRAAASFKRVAREGDEMIVEIRSVQPLVVKGKEKPNHAVAWRVTAEQAKPFVTMIDAREGTVAWTSEPGRALALVAADRKTGFVLRSDLYPLELTPDERAQVIAWLEAGGGGKLRGPLVKYPA